MEFLIASRIRYTRMLGVPIETWIVWAEARQIIYEQYLNKFPHTTNNDDGRFFKATSR